MRFSLWNLRFIFLLCVASQLKSVHAQDLGVNIMDFMTSTGFDLVAFQAAMTQAAAKMAQKAREEEKIIAEAAAQKAKEDAEKKARIEKEEALKQKEQELKEQARIASEKSQNELEKALEKSRLEKEVALKQSEEKLKKSEESNKNAVLKAVKAARAEERRLAKLTRFLTTTTTSSTSTTTLTTKTTVTTTTTTTLNTTTTTIVKTTTATKPKTARRISNSARSTPRRPPAVSSYKLDPKIFGKYHYCRKCTGQTAEDCIKSDKVETCNAINSICQVNVKKGRFLGKPRYTTGCAQMNTCQSMEKQNFGNSGVMRDIFMLQCRPFRLGGVHRFRPINCNFCHKMGTWEKTHLLFQNDTMGTNDPNSILVENEGYVSSNDLKEVYKKPYRFWNPNKVLSNQDWYMVNAPYF